MFRIVNLSTGEWYRNDMGEPYGWESGDEAAQAAEVLCQNTGIKWQVRRVVVDSGVDWESRERGRFESGEYIKPDWIARFDVTIPEKHFLHVSRKNSAMIAFTQNAEKGLADLQTPMRVGAYLQSIGVGSERAQAIALAHANQYAPRGYLVARSADEIERVYLRGPRSCMSHSKSNYRSSEHPVRVYGDSDLSVAYLRDEDSTELHVTARCVIWESEKIFGRCYGDESRLRAALERDGFKHGEMKGAKIRAIECDNTGGWVMPYLDGLQGVRRVGDFFEITDSWHCDIIAGRTDGVTGGEYECERCGDECDETGDVLVSRRNHQGWCESCRDSDSRWCDAVDDRVATDQLVEVDESEWIPEWALDDCGVVYCEGWGIHTRESVVDVQTSRSPETGVWFSEMWSESYLRDHAFQCRIDGLYYANEFRARDSWIDESENAFRCRFTMPDDMPEGFDGVIDWKCPLTNDLFGKVA